MNPWPRTAQLLRQLNFRAICTVVFKEWIRCTKFYRMQWLTLANVCVCVCVYICVCVCANWPPYSKHRDVGLLVNHSVGQFCPLCIIVENRNQSRKLLCERFLLPLPLPTPCAHTLFDRFFLLSLYCSNNFVVLAQLYIPMYIFFLDSH